MKKVLYLSLASVAMFGLASCSNDDLPFDGKAGVETFRLKLPEELASRKYNDGLTATNLKIAVYTASSGELVISNFGEGVNTDLIGGECVFVNREATIDLTLGKNEDYNIVFWAESYSDNSPYEFDATSKQMTIHYENAKANDEARDAFYAYKPITATGIDHTIELFRPFAQVNLGTDDFATAQKTGLTVTKTGLVFSELANIFSFETGECSGSVQNVFFANNDIPNGETFPAGTNMEYLAMAYVLVGSPSAPKATMDVSLYVNNDVYDPANPDDYFSQYPSIPAQQNYQTNIYGSLLTNKEHFTVDIRQAFIDSYNENQNGVPEITPVEKEINGVMTTVYPVASPENLEWLSQQMNEKTVAANSYIELAADINMAGTTIKALPTLTGTFDGQGHTISNLTLEDEKANKGLFVGIGSTGKVKNLTVANSTVTGTVATSDLTGAVGAICGVLNGTIENCHNVNTTINGIGKIGGVVGEAKYNSQIISCTNSGNISSSESAYLGGIVGDIDRKSLTGTKTTTIQECINTGKVDGAAGSTCGGIVGYCPIGAPTTISNCTNNGIVGSSDELAAGGILGLSYSSKVVTINSCSNTAAITADNYAGGIVGGKDTNTTETNLNECTNSGVITSNQYAGGISGGHGKGALTNCVNTGAVKGNTASGGVIGYIARGTLNNCQGGNASVTGGVSGRLIGMIVNGTSTTSAFYTVLNLTAEGNDYSVLPAVGQMGIAGASSNPRIQVQSGEFVGLPAVVNTTQAYVYILEGATWQGMTDPVGTWKSVKNVWTKQ